MARMDVGDSPHDAAPAGVDNMIHSHTHLMQINRLASDVPHSFLTMAKLPLPT